MCRVKKLIKIPGGVIWYAEVDKTTRIVEQCWTIFAVVVKHLSNYGNRKTACVTSFKVLLSF